MHSLFCKSITTQTKARLAAIAVLSSRRDTAANFGNAGEVKNLLDQAIIRKEGRRSAAIRDARDSQHATKLRLDNELVRHQIDHLEAVVVSYACESMFRHALRV